MNKTFINHFMNIFLLDLEGFFLENINLIYSLDDSRDLGKTFTVILLKYLYYKLNHHKVKLNINSLKLFFRA